MTVGFDWLLWLLVGALGGLLALLSAVAVANSYRQRHRTPRGGARQFAAERQASHQRPALATSRSQKLSAKSVLSGDPRVDRPLLQPELMHQDTSGASRDRTDRTLPPPGDSETWDLAVAVEALIP
jgi:hypothetical protein